MEGAANESSNSSSKSSSKSSSNSSSSSKSSSNSSSSDDHDKDAAVRAEAVLRTAVSGMPAAQEATELAFADAVDNRSTSSNVDDSRTETLVRFHREGAARQRIRDRLQPQASDGGNRVFVGAGHSNTPSESVSDPVSPVGPSVGTPNIAEDVRSSQHDSRNNSPRLRFTDGSTETSSRVLKLNNPLHRPSVAMRYQATAMVLGEDRGDDAVADADADANANADADADADANANADVNADADADADVDQCLQQRRQQIHGSSTKSSADARPASAGSSSDADEQVKQRERVQRQEARSVRVIRQQHLSHRPNPQRNLPPLPRSPPVQQKVSDVLVESRVARPSGNPSVSSAHSPPSLSPRAVPLDGKSHHHDNARYNNGASASPAVSPRIKLADTLSTSLPFQQQHPKYSDGDYDCDDNSGNDDDSQLLNMSETFSAPAAAGTSADVPTSSEPAEALGESSTCTAQTLLLSSRIEAAQIVLDNDRTSIVGSRNTALAADQHSKQLAANATSSPGAVAISGTSDSHVVTNARLVSSNRCNDVPASNHPSFVESEIPPLRNTSNTQQHVKQGDTLTPPRGRTNVVRIRQGRSNRIHLHHNYPAQNEAKIRMLQAASPSAPQSTFPSVVSDAATATARDNETSEELMLRLKQGQDSAFQPNKASQFRDNQPVSQPNRAAATKSRSTRPARHNPEIDSVGGIESHVADSSEVDSLAVMPGAYAVEGIDGAVDDEDYDMYGVNNDDWNDSHTLSTDVATGSVSTRVQQSDAVSQIAVDGIQTHRDTELGAVFEDSVEPVRASIPAFLAEQSGSPSQQNVSSQSTLAHDKADERGEDDTDEVIVLKRQRMIRVSLIVATCLIVTVIVAIVVVLVGNVANDSAGKDVAGPSPTLTPRTEREQQLVELLSPVTGNTSRFDVEDSSERQAMLWLTYEDNMSEIDVVKTRTRFVLALMYFSLGRNNIDDAYVDLDECEWAFVTCDDAGRVTQLEGKGRNLAGTVPVELRYLSNLETFDFAVNSISGTIGPQFEGIESFTNLFLGENDIEECQFDKLGSNVGGINLSGNKLMQVIGSHLQRLTSLKVFYITQNQVSSRADDILSNITPGIEDIRIDRNKIGGTLPTEIGRFESLIGLMVDENSIKGTIPTEVGLMTSLEFFSAPANDLVGSIPTEFGQLSDSCRGIALPANGLTGELPTELGLMQALEIFYANGNELDGQIPSELGLLPSVTEIGVHQNFLGGPVPTELGSLTTLELLDLQSNDLTGSIPSQFSNMTAMSYLALSQTLVTGSVPDEMCDFPNILQIRVAPEISCRCVSCTFT